MEKVQGVNVDHAQKFYKYVEIQVSKANKILELIRKSYKFLYAQN